MARLRNRQVKATFYTDGELLRWPREKRFTYQGIWAMAEDSGCLEDDPFEWKLTIWNSPLDADITVEMLADWRNDFITAGKLVPYTAQGKKYLFIVNFHQHEHPRNPQAPDLPLPAWVTWGTKVTTTRDGREHRTNQYEVDTDHPAVRQYLGTGPNPGPDVGTDAAQAPKGSVPTPVGAGKRSPVLSSPVQSCPDQSSPVQNREETLSSAEADAPDTPAKPKPKRRPKATSKEIDDVIALYHELCPSLIKVRAFVLTDARRDAIGRACIKWGMDTLREVFTRAQASDFLTGSRTEWRADLDWLVQPKNLAKVLEGRYDNRQTLTKTQTNVARGLELVRKYDAEEALGEA
jgi:hypothetical protein